MKRLNIWNTIALAVCMGHGIAVAAVTRNACADMNNNGVCDAGDVNIEKQIANDGYFSTARSEGNYQAGNDKVGIVLSGRIAGKSGVLYLVASGDIVVKDVVGSGSETSAVILSSTAGSIKVGSNGKARAGLMLKLTAAGDIILGDKAVLFTRNPDYGGALYVYSSGGSIRVGEKASISGDGFTSLTTNESTGGDVSVGAGARVWSPRSSVAVTAGDAVNIRRAYVSGNSVLIGSHASTDGRTLGGPGQTTLTDCTVAGTTGVRVFAGGGEGSMVDVSGTQFDVADPATVTIDASVVVR